MTHREASEIVRSAVDAAGQAGGIDEVRRIAECGPGYMVFSDEEMGILIEAYGSTGEAMLAIQHEARGLISEDPS